MGFSSRLAVVCYMSAIYMMHASLDLSSLEVLCFCNPACSLSVPLRSLHPDTQHSTENRSTYQAEHNNAGSKQVHSGSAGLVASATCLISKLRG